MDVILPDETLASLVNGVYDSSPDWITTGTLDRDQASALASLIVEFKARNVVEMGTASGFSAALFATVLSHSEGPWSLHTIDYGELCYFDDSKAVGQAFYEICGQQPNVHIHRSTTSLDLPSILGRQKVDFAYIDASHSSPWAAVDLLSIIANLKQGAIIALDDIQLPFVTGYQHQNAGRDFYRSWRGEKWTNAIAPNLGVLRFWDIEQALADIAFNLQMDWDEDLGDNTLANVRSHFIKFEHLEYENKASCALRLYAQPPVVSNGNNFFRIPRFPLNDWIIAHPNKKAEVAPTILLRDVPLCGLKKVVIRAEAFNPHELNPGAVIEFGFGGASYKPKKMIVPPRGSAELVISVPRSLSVSDIRIDILTAHRGASDYAGLRIKLSIH